MLHDVARLVVLGACGRCLGRRCTGKADLCGRGLCARAGIPGTEPARTHLGLGGTVAVGGTVAGRGSAPPGITGAEPAALPGVVLAVQVTAAGAGTIAAGTVAPGAAAPTGRPGVPGRAAGHGVAAAAAPAAQTGTLFQHRAAGLFDVLRLDLAQKAAGLVALGAAVEHAGDAVGDVQFLFGAGDADVGKAALFFQVRLGILAHLAGEHPLLHANEEHIGEFQTLCRVDGHQDHLVSALVVAVNVADEGDILQVAFQ